ncbi:hypothetical protein Areg01_34190 [Actinoplanes regularis]|nr:hypothetical protein Areg01_34190 [Actinoplanes regularis]
MANCGELTRMKLSRTTRARALIMVPVTAALLLAGTASAASASSAPPAANGYDVWCVSVTGAKACFAAYGDRVWVKDTKANGENAAGVIQGPHWARRCINDKGAASGWVMCDFDVPEYQDGLLWAVNNPFIGSQGSVKINTGNLI